MEARSCTVYRGDGDLESLAVAVVDQPWTADEDTAGRTPIHRILGGRLICARRDLDAGSVVRLMLDHHVGCLPVIDDDRRPIGVITKLDIVEQLVGAIAGPGDGPPAPEELRPASADELMMPLAFTLEEHATIAQACALMVSEDVHHVIVVSPTGQITGVVSARDVVQWVTTHPGT